jgi:5'-nucleotidase (lipoprotein e(P4) family)
MRKSAPLLLLLVVACATAPQPQPVVAAATMTPAPPLCNPGIALLNSTVWVQLGAEYRASALATFGTARRMLDAALADPSWNAEEGTSDPSQPPAIILDSDDTIFDNTPFEARVLAQGKTYDQATWDQWVAEASTDAVPGAASFLAYAKSRGVTSFYITNREAKEEAGTRQRIQNLGFPLDPNVDTLLVRGEREEWKSADKTARRDFVAATYRVLLVLGDDLNDFANARDKSVAERYQIVADKENWWGTKWFLVPNPMYGSWERAVTGGTGSPCEQVQKKVDALRK